MLDHCGAGNSADHSPSLPSHVSPTTASSPSQPQNNVVAAGGVGGVHVGLAGQPNAAGQNASAGISWDTATTTRQRKKSSKQRKKEAKQAAAANPLPQQPSPAPLQHSAPLTSSTEVAVSQPPARLTTSEIQAGLVKVLRRKHSKTSGQRKLPDGTRDVIDWVSRTWAEMIARDKPQSTRHILRIGMIIIAGHPTVKNVLRLGIPDFTKACDTAELDLSRVIYLN
jgi:hypothetical protein